MKQQNAINKECSDEGPSPVKIEPDVYFQQNNTFNGGGGSRAETITWQ